MSFLFFASDLPKSNQIILDYVNANMGKKVGSGVCFELVDGAMNKIDKAWDKKHHRRQYLITRTYISVYGKRISKSKLLPGDIIAYNWKWKKEHKGATKGDHICIVYKIEGDKIYVAEQSASGSSSKSKVVVNCWDDYKSYLKIYRIKYYRPF